MRANQRLTRILILLTLPVLMIPVRAWYSADATVQALVISSHTHIATSTTFQKGLSVKALVALLDARDHDVRANAEKELKNIGRSSPNLRNEVITELLGSIRLKSELDGTHFILSASTYEFWESAVNIIMNLRITEAIDAMITCVHCGNGYSGNMGEPPAFIALIRMGDVAIPKLSNALTKEPAGLQRLRIVRCLSGIGGPKAKQALRKVLSIEKDQTIREYILRALK